MLLPLRIDIEYQRRPWGTLAILAGCVTLFAWTAPGRGGRLSSLALDPDAFRQEQLFTSMFAHIDMVHLAGNMIFLLVFGRYVEERLGTPRFLLAYLLFGLLASVAYLLLSARGGPGTPVVGASGAVAGTMGFTLYLIPRAKLVLAWFRGDAGRLPRISIWALLVIWVLLQLPEAAAAPYAGFAWAAHLGGLAAGAMFAWWLASPHTADSAWHLVRARDLGSTEDALKRKNAAIYAAIARYRRERRGGKRVSYAQGERASRQAAPAPSPENTEEPPARPGAWTLEEGVRDTFRHVGLRLLLAVPVACIAFAAVLIPVSRLPNSGLLLVLFGVTLGSILGAVVAWGALRAAGFAGWIPMGITALGAAAAILVGLVLAEAMRPFDDSMAQALSVGVLAIGAGAAVFRFMGLED